MFDFSVLVYNVPPAYVALTGAVSPLARVGLWEALQMYFYQIQGRVCLYDVCLLASVRVLASVLASMSVCCQFCVCACLLGI